VSVRRELEIKMRPSGNRLHVSGIAVLACLLTCLTLNEHALAAQPGQTIIPHLQQRFGLSEPQVRGALGALLVFVREQLPKPEFDDLAQRIPNADQIMQDVKLQGIVTKPLDDIEDYQESLSSLRIGQPLASQFAPAVVEYLGAAGYTRERDILARVVH
jgi:Protein of unknown function VcgC/VcgE (DUF2780)